MAVSVTPLTTVIFMAMQSMEGSRTQTEPSQGTNLRSPPRPADEQWLTVLDYLYFFPHLFISWHHCTHALCHHSCPLTRTHTRQQRVNVPTRGEIRSKFNFGCQWNTLSLLYTHTQCPLCAWSLHYHYSGAYLQTGFLFAFVYLCHWGAWPLTPKPLFWHHKVQGWPLYCRHCLQKTGSPL
jgi:hypothetical protein